jgi:Zn-dependent M28 family amino/carboxypeptidase
LTAVAVYSTVVPEHTVLELALILKLTAKPGLTVIVMAFDSAGEPVAHGSEDVSRHVTISPFKGA